MTQFQPIFAFLLDLRQNNNHEWFEAHRTEYDQAKLLFKDFIQGLIFRFDAIEPLGDLAAKDATISTSCPLDHFRRAAHACCRSAGPSFAGRSRRDSRRPNVSSASSLLT
jgi:hypothetical protein